MLFALPAFLHHTCMPPRLKFHTLGVLTRLHKEIIQVGVSCEHKYGYVKGSSHNKVQLRKNNH